MKTSLIDFAERRHLAPFALRRRRAARGGFATALRARASAQRRTEPHSHGPPASLPGAALPAGRELSEAAPPCDLAVQRGRAAGGPMDRASYACGCGYLFLAVVSTTVACPHCQATQAW